MSPPHPHVHNVLKRIRGTSALIRLNPKSSRFRIYCLVLHPNPEIVANIQSIYSRDPRSIENRLDLLSPKRARQFMAEYYAHYGHRSIADCGGIVLFYEDVPLHFAKQIQRDPRYKGQEASTRYIKLSAQMRLLNTRRLPGGEEILRRWLETYDELYPVMLRYLETEAPMQPGESEKNYKRAVHARACDILRCLLPLDTPTNVSWSATLREALDDLRIHSQHPDIDISAIAQETLDGLQEIFPSSFSPPQRRKERDPKKRKAARTDWEQRHQRYVDRLNWQKQTLEHIDGMWSLKKHWRGPTTSKVTGRFVKWAVSEQALKLLETRPAFCDIPYDFDIMAWYDAEFLMDYGSFRDLQRHRAIVFPIPILTTQFGFEKWYLDQMPPECRDRVRRLLVVQEEAIRRLPGDWRAKQPYIALGYKVPVMMSGPLRGWLYLFELRSKGDVHHTVRAPIHRLVQRFRDDLEQIRPGLSRRIAIQVYTGIDDWRKRGQATFISHKTGTAIGD